MRLLIVGQGYSGTFIARAAAARGWSVRGTTRDGRDGTITFGGASDAAALDDAIQWASHVLASAPPGEGGDPVLAVAGDRLTGRWLGYLSSTGVYGDTSGAWVDESAAIGGRRPARAAADAAWLALGARVFRLPGIYGPGRSPIDRVRAGSAHLVDAPGQVFSRIHVDDLAAGVIAGLDAPPGAYNLADDRPASANEVTAFAARLAGVAVPATVPLASLSRMAQGFYAENRRVATGKAKRVLGWAPRYADYRLGLRALSATTSPTPVTAAPATASADQR